MSKLLVNCDNQLINGDLLGKAVYETLKQRVNLSAEICFCDKDEIQRLNKENRGIDSVTDVLSFPAAGVTAGEIVKKKNYPFDLDPENGSVFLGSIMICTDRAKEQAEEFGHSFGRELYYLAVHGMLHLFGYDHMNDEDKAEMRALEEEILKKLDKTRED